MGVGAEAEIYRLMGRKKHKVPGGNKTSDLLQVDCGAVHDNSMRAYGLLHMLHSRLLLKIPQAMGQSSASVCSKQANNKSNRAATKNT